MQLIGADKVEFPARYGLIARVGEIVGDTRLIGGQRRRIVVHPDSRGITPRHQRGTRWSAERTGGIGRVKANARFCQPVEIRGLDHKVTIGAGQERRQLVSHDEEDIGRIFVSAPAHPCTPLWVSGRHTQRVTSLSEELDDERLGKTQGQSDVADAVVLRQPGRRAVGLSLSGAPYMGRMLTQCGARVNTPCALTAAGMLP